MDDGALHDMFAAIGPISIRRMFGGKGVYADGMIVAVVLSTGELHVKGDEETRALYEGEGAVQWVPHMNGRVSAMPYWRVPADVLDDQDALDRWAHLARDVARRAAASGKKPASKKPATKTSAKKKTK